MDEVLILGEAKAGSLSTRTIELLGAGQKLAGDVGAFSLLLMGENVAGAADAALEFGPAKVYKMEHPLLAGFHSDVWVGAVAQVCQAVNPKILLMDHGFVGMELAPRLAGRLDTRLTTDCVDLAVDSADGLLLATKPVSGGNAVSVFKYPGQPQMATVRSKSFDPAESVGAKGEIVEMKADFSESMMKVQSLETVEEEVVSLDKANVVVAGGAGLGEEEGFEVLEELRGELSKSFNNVMIGCSRVAVDKGWISSDHQVGLTGAMIAPDIYVAVGISGAIQHLVGMAHAKKIIAVNTDESCNIFKVADYGIVEDYEEIIPSLVEKLEELS